MNKYWKKLPSTTGHLQSIHDSVDYSNGRQWSGQVLFWTLTFCLMNIYQKNCQFQLDTCRVFTTLLTIITTEMVYSGLVKFYFGHLRLSNEHILEKLPSSTRHLPSIHDTVDYNRHSYV